MYLQSKYLMYPFDICNIYKCVLSAYLSDGYSKLFFRKMKSRIKKFYSTFSYIVISGTPYIQYQYYV